MTDQRRNDRGRGRWDAPAPPKRDEPPRDPGAYIGRLPERATQPMPPGMGRRDTRGPQFPAPRAPEGGRPNSEPESNPTTAPEASSTPDGPNTPDNVAPETGQGS
jgi:hypothetical protein